MKSHTDKQRIEDCRSLYVKYGGKRHEQIEAEMRALGHTRFCRRIMHTRRERGRTRPGWIERFGWKAAITNDQLRITNSEKSSNDSRDPNIRNLSFVIRNSNSVAAALRTPARPKHNHAKRRRLEKLKARRLLQKHRRNAGIPARNEHEVRTKAYDVLGAELTPTSPAGEARIAGTDARVPANFSPDSLDSPDSPDSFQAWLKTLPGIWNWDWRHQIYLYEHLKRVTDGTCKRLMIFMPPRHGKSELVTVRYAAWRLMQDPR